MKEKEKEKSAAAKGLRYLKKHGPGEFAAHAAEKVRDARFAYDRWVRSQEIGSAQAGYQRSVDLKRMPEVYVMALRAEGEIDPRTMESVHAQTWRSVKTADTLTTHMPDEAFLLCVPSGSILTRSAVYELMRAVQDGADCAYADEDRYTVREPEASAPRLSFAAPLFKPDYNPDYLRSVNYVGSILLVRVGLVRQYYEADGAGVPDAVSLSDAAAWYDFVLRCTRSAAALGGVRHVPKVLLHAAVPPLPFRGDADQHAEHAADADRCAPLRVVLERDLERRGLSGEVEDGARPGTFHVRYAISGTPLVSIVIPNKDNVSVLENCIWSIRNRSSWKHIEIIVVENNSAEQATFDYYRALRETEQARVIEYGHAFNFSRIINEGVREAKGEYVILMNNDVTVRTEDWIERLLSHCMRKEVGAAGPKLLYPDGTVQSAGIVAGLMGFAGSMMVGADGADPGYMGRAVLAQDMSAVTAACVMVKKHVFRQVGGFRPELAVALNDVDFCLRLVRSGWRVVLDPTAVMIHHESLTRGQDDAGAKRRRFRRERALFRRLWSSFLKQGDPAYNPNLSRRRCDWSQQT